MNVNEIVPGTAYTTFNGIICLILSVQLLPIVTNNQQTANITILVTTYPNRRYYISDLKRYNLGEIFEDRVFLLPEITD